MAEAPLDDALDDEQWRLRVFRWLDVRLADTSGALSREELTSAAAPIKLLDTGRGIRNPRELESTLSIMSTPTGPYANEQIEGGLFRYAFRAGDAYGGDNRKLRVATERRAPMVLLLKDVGSGGYVPIYPVFSIGVDEDRQQFLIALDESLRFSDGEVLSSLERQYVGRLTRQRLHQPVFRARVLAAYGERCALCRLAHPSLLDAAHIVADSDEGGQPLVVNGLAMCKIHHAAYDRDILGITPEAQPRVEVDRAVLEEVDGPMLRHGLQELHGAPVQLPARERDRPDQDRLAARYARFAAAR